MFSNLSENLGKVFDKLKGKGVISEADLNQAMREVRIALLEADVSLSVVKEFIEEVKEKALGEDVVKSITPGQMIIKIVQDSLTQVLGEGESELKISSPPSSILMLGLQGSGKTTSSAKLALFLKKKNNKKILLVSLDVYRPAAQKQLELVSKQAGVDSLEIIEGQKPKDIAKRAFKEAKNGGYDVVIYDSAGRLHIDEELLDEIKSIEKIVKPSESLLVLDAMTGQDAVNIASNFKESVGLTGVILTRMDGDARGGAALSMKSVTNTSIKFVGVGEKIDEFEVFHPERVSSRILGMGDIVSLVEKASESVDKNDAEKLAKKIKKGIFDLNDLSKQLKTMKKMGGLSSLMSMMPGMGKIKKEMNNAQLDERLLLRQEAIISSMTKKERSNPKILNGSRKRRIAAGCGLEVQDVNRLLKQFKQMQTMMKKIGKMDKRSLSGLGKNIFGDI